MPIPMSMRLNNAEKRAAPYERRGTTIVNVRVPQALVANMDLWVENGEFRSRSEFVVTAIRQYLDYLPTRKTAREARALFEEDEGVPQTRSKR